MKTPTVVNIHVIKGKRPDFDLYIGRAQNHAPHTVFKQSKWFNPFTFKIDGEKALLMYEIYIISLLKRHWPENHERYDELEISEQSKVYRKVKNAIKKGLTWDIDELEGLKLGCWCINSGSWKNPTCHGQVLMKLFAIKHHKPGTCDSCTSDNVEVLQEIDPGVNIMLCLDCENTFIVEDKNEEPIDPYELRTQR